MKFVCSSLMLLISLSTSYAFFWAGYKKPYSKELIRKTDSWMFMASKCRYIHFNTCREYNLIVDRVEVNTISGNGDDIVGKVVFGGEEDFYVALELCGLGQATYETTIWGHFRSTQNTQNQNQNRQNTLPVNVDSAFMTFDQFWPCKDAIKRY